MNQPSPIIPADRFAGALVGLGVGSALGQPVESMSPAQVRIKLGLVGEYREGGWRGLRRGEHTPEAELALLLGRRLLRDGRHDPDRVAADYVAYFRDVRPELEETTRSVLALIDQGIPASRAAEEAHENATAKDEDCAALLRVVPLVLAFAHQPMVLVRAVSAEVRLTHHGRQIEGAAHTLAFLLVDLLAGASDPERLLTDARERLAGVDPPLRCTLAPPAVARVARTCASGRPEDVLESVWAAFCSSRHPGKALTRVVSGGEDAATAGALVGALVGARAGVNGLPAAWVDGLLDAARFRKTAERLYLWAEGQA